MMDFGQPLRLGTLIRRYKRFLADIALDDGEVITAHVANTGAMTGLATPGSRVALSHHPGRGRKLPFSWELVQVGETWVLINTARPNQVVEDAIRAGRIGPLRGYPEVRREVFSERRADGSRSRLDLLLERPGESCHVEVKSVTLSAGRRALFPDAVTVRGARHLAELEQVARNGDRAVMLFLVGRDDCTTMSPADAVDPEYGRLLRQAVAAGVEAHAYRLRATPERLEIDRKIPVQLADAT